MPVLFSIIPSDSFFDFVNTYRISNVIVSTITIIPVYFISAKFFGKYLGLLGASLIAFEPKLILNSTMINNESIFLLAISIVILLFFYKNFKTLAISFAIVAITSHIRYEALILLIPITILYFINYKNEKKYLIKYTLCIILFLAVLLPFLFLNYSNTGNDGLTNHYTSAIIQDYDQYTSIDHSCWRFIMRLNKAYFSKKAHHK